MSRFTSARGANGGGALFNFRRSRGGLDGQPVKALIAVEALTRRHIRYHAARLGGFTPRLLDAAAIVDAHRVGSAPWSERCGRAQCER
jgi:hypothetical protein